MLEVDLSEATIEEVIAETIVESNAIVEAIEEAIEEVIAETHSCRVQCNSRVSGWRAVSQHSGISRITPYPDTLPLTRPSRSSRPHCRSGAASTSPR